VSLKPTVAENRWLGQLHRLMAKKPKAIWFFCNGSAYAMRRNAEGRKAEGVHGCVDQNYVLDTPAIKDFEGGDW
jgi:hypothetical protein